MVNHRAVDRFTFIDTTLILLWAGSDQVDNVVAFLS